MWYNTPVQGQKTQKKRFQWRLFWPYLVIASVWFLIVITNFRLGTWLTGWDNLHPEWDPTYDLWRSFNAVWQEYQGVGLLGGMAHAADLVRQFIVLFISIILPRSLIRYTLLFSQLLLGSLGCFALFRELFTDRHDSFKAKLAALAAALFYLLNLGTVQNFYVAFEPFYWFYGMLPWLLYTLHSVWRFGYTRFWLQFALVSFLATPLAYLQTNFVVYAILLVCLGLAYLFSRRPHVKFTTKLTRLVGSASIILLTNLFWLAPMVYFVATGGSQTTIRSQVNQISTREVSMQNQAYGNWRDILLLRGYWFASQDYNDADDSQDPIAFMQTWMSEPATAFMGVVFAFLLFVGAGYLLFYRRDYRTFGVLTGFAAMCGLLLINRLDFTFIGQVFRSPYTKVIVPLSLLYSLLVGASFLLLARLLRARVLIFSFAFYLVALALYSIPTFGGHFIYHNLRQTMPADYDELFAFMRTQERAARTALLPAETIYGWQHTTWGYRGIGFYWFGLRQSILDRAFDVWSFDNEEFYQELHFARLEGDSTLFRRVLDKYNVRYLIYDATIHRRGRDSELFHRDWQQLATAADCRQIHTSAQIEVYDCQAQIPLAKAYVTAPEQYYVSNTRQFHQFYDPAATKHHYLTGPSEQALDYPFAFLYAREPGDEQISYDASASGNLATVHLDAILPSHDYHELYVPSFLEASRSSFLVNLTAKDKKDYVVTLSPLFTLEVNGQTYQPFAPVTFTAPYLDDADEIYFDFGTDYTRLKSGEASSSAIVSLGNFHQEQTWRYFAAGSARTRGLNINVNLRDTIELTVPETFWDFWREPQTLTLNEPLTSLTAHVTTIPHYLRSFATSDAVNCDVIERGSVDRQENGEHGYTYLTSGYGSYCDTFFDSSLDAAKHSFLLRIDARNLEGLPLTYYFWDVNKKVQSWETLLQGGDRTTQTFSFPRVATDQDTAFFDVHPANRSIAGETAHNVLEQTVSYVVPLHELAGIQLRGRDGDEVHLNSLEVSQVSKAGTSEYRVEVSFPGSNDGVLVLAQGYHPGWQAHLGGQLLAHQEYDGWANAWLIPRDICPDDHCTVTISYWPQYLGWLGLAVSLASFAVTACGLLYLDYRRFTQPHYQPTLKHAFYGQRQEEPKARGE